MNPIAHPHPPGSFLGDPVACQATVASAQLALDLCDVGVVPADLGQGGAARAMAGRICVAQIGGPHGIRGEVKLKSFTADPMAVKDYAPLESEDGACPRR